MFPLGRRYRTPNDKLTRQSAELLLSPSEARDRLTSGTYINEQPDDVTGSIEYAFHRVIEADSARRKLKASREQRPYELDYEGWMAKLVSSQVLTQEEADLLIKAEDATHRVIMVDDFPNDFRQGAAPGHEEESYIRMGAAS